MNKRVQRKNLDRRLFWFGALILAGTWISILLIIREDRRLEIERTRAQTDNLAAVLEQHITGTLLQIENTLQFLVQAWDCGHSQGKIHEHLDHIVATRRDLFNLLSIIDSEGHVLMTDQDEAKPTYSGDRPFFLYHKEHADEGMRIGEPMVGRVTGKWFLPFSMRLEDDEGRFAGVVLASINPFYFSMIFKEVKLGAESLIYLADADGVVYSGMMGGEELVFSENMPKVNAAFVMTGQTDDLSVNRSALDGVERIRSLAFIPARRMLVSVAVGLRDCLAPTHTRAIFLLGIQFLFSLCIFFFLFRLHRAIKAKEEFGRELERFFTTSLDLLCIADMQSRFIRVNKEWENTLGYRVEELEQSRFLDYIHPDDMQATLDAMDKLKNQETVLNLTSRCRCKDGSYRHIEWRSTPKGNRIYAAARDITERIQAEEERIRLQGQLAQARKMESVGRLAGGVAHDFNNMLQTILGNTELALERLDPSDPTHAELLEIQKAAVRSTNLARQLLAFARKQTVAPKLLDLNETVEGMLKMLRCLIGENIDLVWRPGSTLWPVHMDPSQIDQILANLCVNARDAINGVGHLIIETSNITFDAASCATHPECQPGDYVALVVSDDGCGMDEETLTRVFEPFFTTKDVGKGTGLGLATTYGIVKQNNGFIHVHSKPGQGTVFKIYVPRHQGAPEDPPLPGAAPEAVSHGRETILLVEDESSILQMTSTMLRRLDYHVLAAQSPGEALQLARAHAGEIHLLMTDVIMPEMNGRDLADNLLPLYPGMKRLFMSGYTADIIANHGMLDPGVLFIQKPFTRQDLAANLKKILSA